MRCGVYIYTYKFIFTVEVWDCLELCPEHVDRPPQSYTGCFLNSNQKWYFPENYRLEGENSPSNRRNIYNIHPFLWVPGAAAPALLRVHGADIEVLKSCANGQHMVGFYKYNIPSYHDYPPRWKLTWLAGNSFFLSSRWICKSLVFRGHVSFPRCNSILLVS